MELIKKSDAIKLIQQFSEQSIPETEISRLIEALQIRTYNITMCEECMFGKREKLFGPIHCEFASEDDVFFNDDFCSDGMPRCEENCKDIEIIGFDLSPIIQEEE